MSNIVINKLNKNETYLIETALANNYAENVYNPLKFTGQWYDAEIGQYYLRARQYDPELMRFISRDPVRGKYENPLTLHPYLYCINAPTQFVDLNGEEFSLPIAIQVCLLQHADAI
jgi:RHS repeat-associated protein